MEQPPMETALSTAVVMDIVLRHLKVEDLLSCRKVSKFWNTAASSVLRKRSTMIKNISKKKTLRELEECLKQSLDFPFAGLAFDQPSRLQSAGAMRFFKNHGARFTRIYLGVSSKTRLQDIAPIVHHLSRLSILEVGSPWVCPPDVELYDSAAGQEDDRILNLPSLRTLRIYSEFNEDVLREVCAVASQSLRVECLGATHGILRALKRVGKLEAVSVMNIDEDDDEKAYALRVDKLLSSESPALTKLDFNAGGCISRKGLMKILISSQHTLKELRLVQMCPSEFSSKCPVLAKLTKLSIFNEKSGKFLFQGSQGHMFPALTELELHDDFASVIWDGLFIVPTVTRIDFEGFVGIEQMKEFAQTFPNVVEIGLHFNFYYELEDFAEPGESIPSEIWSVREFKQLEKLRIRDFAATRPTDTYLNMDTFLTGIPLSICKNLEQQEPELMRNLIKSPFGEKFSEVIRENPNILQLKNLKELIICVRLKDGLKGIPKEPTFMSMVSVIYALEMMPNLEAKFVYEYSSLTEYFK